MLSAWICGICGIKNTVAENEGNDLNLFTYIYPFNSISSMTSPQDNVCEEKVFEGLFLQLSKSLRDYLFFLCGDRQKSDDVVQDIFVKLWEKCKDVPPAKARAFLFKIAKNQFLTDVEKQKVRLRYKSEKQTKTNTEDTQFELESAEFKQKLEDAIAALPEGQREVFLMNRIQKMTYAEIAEALEVSQKAVEKRMSKALKKMRSILYPPKKG